MQLPHPVQYSLTPPTHITRSALVLRALAFFAFGALGVSVGTLFLIAYLALPLYAAWRLSEGSPERYVARDGARFVNVLHWLAAAFSWATFLADRLPSPETLHHVRLEVNTSGVAPTPRAALERIVTSLPSVLLLVVMAWGGALMWLVSAVRIAATTRVGEAAQRYLLSVQRASLQLLVYQASLVDEPMSLRGPDEQPLSAP